MAILAGRPFGVQGLSHRLSFIVLLAVVVAVSIKGGGCAADQLPFVVIPALRPVVEAVDSSRFYVTIVLCWWRLRPSSASLSFGDHQPALLAAVGDRVRSPASCWPLLISVPPVVSSSCWAQQTAELLMQSPAPGDDSCLDGVLVPRPASGVVSGGASFSPA